MFIVIIAGIAIPTITLLYTVSQDKKDGVNGWAK